MAGKISDSLDSTSYLYKDQLSVRAGLQNVLQIFVTNAANVFLLEVSPEYPILLEEQVEMCKRVLNIYRWQYGFYQIVFFMVRILIVLIYCCCFLAIKSTGKSEE